MTMPYSVARSSAVTWAAFFLPVRVQHLLFEQVAADLLDPLRLDGGDAPAKQARGSTSSAATIQRPGFCSGARRVLVELDAARAQVPVVLVALAAHVAQQAGQHRQVNLLVAGRLRVDAPAMCSVTTVSSWVWMSRHSRRRRMLMKFCRSSASYWRLLSLCVRVRLRRCGGWALALRPAAPRARWPAKALS